MTHSDWSNRVTHTACVRLEAHVLFGQKNHWKPTLGARDFSCTDSGSLSPFVASAFGRRSVGLRVEGSHYPREKELLVPRVTETKLYLAISWYAFRRRQGD